jgi:hypothetical protein
MSAETARPRPLLRLNPKAQLVPPAQFARWHEIASATDRGKTGFRPAQE